MAFVLAQLPHLKEGDRTGGMAEVVECLPSKCEALSSNPNTTERKSNIKLSPFPLKKYM
jgi:hypothetical protein